MTEKCLICEGDYYPESLKDGKCSVCAKEYPNAKNRDEALRQTVSKKDQMSTLTEMRVREIAIEEIQKGLDAYKAAKDADRDGMKPANPDKYESHRPKKAEKTEEQKQKAKDRMAKARAARSSKKETEAKKETD